MTTRHAPQVGAWYQRLDDGLEFEVTALDEDAGEVELQERDGETARLDLDSWYDLDVQPVGPSFTDSLDELDPDQFGYDDPDRPGAGAATATGIEPRRFDEGDEEEE